MIKVSIVGTGNLSHHLIQSISKAEGIGVLEVISSRIRSFKEILAPTRQDHGVQKHEFPDIYILTVSDDAIASVSEIFKKTKRLVVHTSGSVPMDSLPKEIRKGVFYPLQTFSKKTKVDFKEVPLCIEAENNEDLHLLRKLAEKLSNNVIEVSTEKRARLHLAAVFVNNFTNHLYEIGAEICKDQDLPFSLLEPLIVETANKIKNLSPLEAQTGPARRNDLATIRSHMELLEDSDRKEIYSQLSKSIRKTYGKKL